MMDQVRSFDPSLTKQTRLFSLIFPSPISFAIFTFRRFDVSGSTSSSL